MPGKMSDPSIMPEKKMKSEGDVGEDEEIRASTGKCWIWMSIGKGRIPESVEKVESGRVPRNGRIRESAGKV